MSDNSLTPAETGMAKPFDGLAITIAFLMVEAILHDRACRLAEPKMSPLVILQERDDLAHRVADVVRLEMQSELAELRERHALTVALLKRQEAATNSVADRLALASEVLGRAAERRDETKAELARLLALLADAWVLPPLEWVTVHGTYGGFRSRCGKYEVWARTDVAGIWYWMSDKHHVSQLCSSIADGQRKAEAWHFERATAHFTKVVAS